MSSSPDQNRFAPPTARVDDVADDAAIQLGGRGQRLAAALIDGLIQGGVYYLLATTVLRGFVPNPTTPSSAGFGSILTSFVIGAALFLLIQGYLLVTQGQTVGKKLMGLRIVRSNGERVDAVRVLFLRSMLFWIIAIVPFIGAIVVLVDVLLIFRDSRKCLHDNVADTVVVKA